MKTKCLLLLCLVFTSSGFAQLADALLLEDGQYQLILSIARAGDPSQKHDLSTTVVKIFHKDSRAFIAFDGATEAEISTGAQQTFVVAVSRPYQKGSLALLRIFAGRSIAPVYPTEPAPSMRIEGEYREIWAGGELSGEFALYRIPGKNG